MANERRAGGTPGYDDTLLAPGSVIINEVLAHTDVVQGDMIELYNATDQPIDLGGWFLSDAKTNALGNNVLTKYQIPAMPAIAPAQYVVFYEDQHFSSVLVQQAGRGRLSLVRRGRARAATANASISASRRATSRSACMPRAPAKKFTLLSTPTFTATNTNSGPYLEDVVINEVAYHPGMPSPGEMAAGYWDDDFEYIELYNGFDNHGLSAGRVCRRWRRLFVGS